MLSQFIPSYSHLHLYWLTDSRSNWISSVLKKFSFCNLRHCTKSFWQIFAFIFCFYQAYVLHWILTKVKPRLTKWKEQSLECYMRKDFYVNKSKNEKHHVNKYSNKSWRRHQTQESFSSWKLSHLFKSILKSKLMSESVRIRVFKAYFESIFVCNSELQTLTKALESFINSFQFRLLRKLIHVVWPKIITNVDLYECTKATPWSITICKRRLLWFGHLLCLPSETLASQSRKAFTKTW